MNAPARSLAPARRQGSGPYTAGGGYRLVTVVVVLAVLSACSGSPAVKAYKATAYTVHGVKVAMLAFNDEYQAGHFTEADRTKVIEVYEKYRKAIKAAIHAQKLALTAQGEPVPEQVLTGQLQTLAAEVVDLIESLRGAK